MCSDIEFVGADQRSDFIQIDYHITSSSFIQKSDLAQSSIFTGEEELFAFERTVSRLTEMQTEEYWNLRSSVENSGSWWCVNLGNFIFIQQSTPIKKVCDYFVHIHVQEAVFNLPHLFSTSRFWWTMQYALTDARIFVSSPYQWNMSWYLTTSIF